jgi:hypothetical protein
LEQINPYAVVRNTATYEAFKAYHRKAAGAGAPFFIFGFMLTMLSPQVFMLGGRWLLHSPTPEARWALWGLAASIFLGAILCAVGVIRMIRFRREHPIPEEWRQIPRSTWPPALEQRPRLRPRD